MYVCMCVCVCVCVCTIYRLYTLFRALSLSMYIYSLYTIKAPSLNRTLPTCLLDIS